MNPISLQENEVLNGFTLLQKKVVKEIDSTTYLFKHKKSGAELYFVSNDDSHKAFSINFKTLPKDDTGVAHILEHSVLCGSRKFPVKDPFIEMSKGSLKTFLNAMTGADRTMYPIASLNDKDFFNLMDVYLDAVLYPRIYNYPEILKQEGWRYELTSKDAPLNIRGIVYNEMKGAFSSPEQVLMSKAEASLYPETIYANESGGDPDSIPELTQENFLKFHSQYYHPANSFIYIYGNADPAKVLEFIDNKYLAAFEMHKPDTFIPTVAPFAVPVEEEYEYPISENDNEEAKAYFALNFCYGDQQDAVKNLGIDVLHQLLMSTPASLLKKKLLEAELAADVSGVYDNNKLQPSYHIILKESSLSQKKKFEDVVFLSLQEIVEKGINPENLEAAINSVEFVLREAEFGYFPKGLVYMFTAYNAWYFGADPSMSLEYEAPLAKIKELAKERYFENLIKEMFLENTHRSLITLKPKKGLAEQKAQELSEKLQVYKNSLSTVEIEEIVKFTEHMQAFQAAADREEDLAKIPTLSLEDIEPDVQELPLEVVDFGKAKLLNHKVFTNNIAYLDFHFDLDSLSAEELPYAGLLAQVIGQIGTAKHSFDNLVNEIQRHTGGIAANTQVFNKVKEDKCFRAYFCVTAKAVNGNKEKLLTLLEEILTETVFTDKRRLGEILRQLKSRLAMRYLSMGHTLAMERMFSYFTPSYLFKESLSGFDFYKFICEQERSFESAFAKLAENLAKVYSKLLGAYNLTISHTNDEKNLENWTEALEKFTYSLHQEKQPALQFALKFPEKNEAFLTPGKVQYVAKGFNLKDVHVEYSGAFSVMKTLLNSDYLINRIRIQGGAYGAFAVFTRTGNFAFLSYRDPNLTETLDVYDHTAEYLQQLELPTNELVKLIIGTISGIDYPLSPIMKGQQAAMNYFIGITTEDRRKEKEDVLKVTAQELKNFAEPIKKAMQQNFYCVVGGESRIKSDAGIFSKVIDVFQV